MLIQTFSTEKQPNDYLIIKYKKHIKNNNLRFLIKLKLIKNTSFNIKNKTIFLNQFFILN